MYIVSGYTYIASPRAVYSYKCNWDLYIQHIDRPPPPPTHHNPHCMPLPFNYWFSSSSNPNTEHTPHSTTGLVSLQFHITCLPVSRVYLEISTFQASGYTSPSLDDHSISSSETLVKQGHLFHHCV